MGAENQKFAVSACFGQNKFTVFLMQLFLDKKKQTPYTFFTEQGKKSKPCR